MLSIANTLLRHGLSVATLMFIVLPFVSNMTHGTIGLNGVNVAGIDLGAVANTDISSTVSKSMHEIMATVQSGGGFASLGGSPALYNGGAHPIFLN